MKRFAALALTLIISLSICMPCVYAEEAEVTRLDVFKQMAEVFNLQPDGNIMPLLAYNDWASVTGQDRYIVASVLGSGIFTPATASVSYNSPMTKEDFDCLTFGLTIYGMRTEGYNFISGKLTSVNRKGAVITDNHGTEYKFEDGIPVIKGIELDNTFTGIATGLTVEVVYDDNGKGIIGWAKRSAAATVKHLYKGTLYVNDEINGNLVFKDLSVLRSDTWVTVKDLYLTGAICEETLLILDGKKVSVKDINKLYLDKKATIIVGEKYDKPCILYVLFE